MKKLIFTLSILFSSCVLNAQTVVSSLYSYFSSIGCEVQYADSKKDSFFIKNDDGVFLLSYFNDTKFIGLQAEPYIASKSQSSKVLKCCNGVNVLSKVSKAFAKFSEQEITVNFVLMYNYSTYSDFTNRITFLLKDLTQTSELFTALYENNQIN